jgi:hypothetical protein
VVISSLPPYQHNFSKNTPLSPPPPTLVLSVVHRRLVSVPGAPSPTCPVMPSRLTSPKPIALALTPTRTHTRDRFSKNTPTNCPSACSHAHTGPTLTCTPSLLHCMHARDRFSKNTPTNCPSAHSHAHTQSPPSQIMMQPLLRAHWYVFLWVLGWILTALLFISLSCAYRCWYEQLDYCRQRNRHSHTCTLNACLLPPFPTFNLIRGGYKYCILPHSLTLQVPTS